MSGGRIALGAALTIAAALVLGKAAEKLGHAIMAPVYANAINDDSPSRPDECSGLSCPINGLNSN